MAANPVPSESPGVTPYLIVRDAARALEFYRTAFGAEVVMRMDGPGGKVMHSELGLAGGRYMLADEFPDMGFVGPQTLGGAGASLLFYVEDVDERFRRAIEAGATELRPVKDQFYGDRSGTLRDPFGHVWTIATHVEDVPPEEMDRRAQEAMGG